MRTRTTTNSVTVDSDTGGRLAGTAAGGTTCNREVSLQEVISDYWGGNFPTRESITIDETIHFTDTITPNYALRRKKGEVLPTNPMVKETFRVIPEGTVCRSSIAYCFYRSKPCKDKPWDTISYRLGTKEIKVRPIKTAPRDLISSSELQDVQREAIAKLRSQGIDYLTTLVELRQTLAMLAGAKQRLIDIVVKMVQYVRRLGKKPKTWSDLLDLVGGAWLEGRFGWRILYYDLKAIVQYVENLKNDPKLIVGRSKRSATRDYSSNYGDYTVVDELQVGYPGTLSYDIPGASSILNTVWEVIPFSLVVDMFFDVQSWIISLSGATANVKEHPSAAFLTRTKTVYGNAQIEKPLPPEGYSAIYFNEPSVVSQFYEQKTRSWIDGPSVGLPPFRFNLGGFKPVDLAFLMRILIGKL